jgi:hypothetical protein
MSRRRKEEPDLPKGFLTIRQILDGDDSVSKTVGVVGVATDWRAPVATRRSGEKHFSATARNQSALGLLALQIINLQSS